MKIKAVFLLLFIQSFYLQAQEKHPADVLDFTTVEAKIKEAIAEKKIPSMVIAISRDEK